MEKVESSVYHSDNIDKFFSIARERYQILLNRRAGLPKPWTKDPIFQNNRFCNVLREDDRTTEWFRENIRAPLDEMYGISPWIILRSIVAFRWFNKIETWDTILSSGRGLENIFGSWDTEWIRQEIADHVKPPYVTGSYIIKTPNGMNKVDGVLWCIDQFNKGIEEGKFDKIFTYGASMEEACELLQTVPFLGRFMAYQIVCDARFTSLLENAPDINTWAQPGPGSTRGIGRTFYNDPDKFKYGSIKDEKEVILHMKSLLDLSRIDEYWPKDWPVFELSTIQHWACEVDKHTRITSGEGRMKRKYNAT